jgi:hypothetical protein
MHCADTQAGFPAISALDLHRDPVHPKSIVDDEPDWGILRQTFTTTATGVRPHGYLLRRRGITVYRPSGRAPGAPSDIFHFVEASSTRSRIVFAVKKKSNCPARRNRDDQSCEEAFSTVGCKMDSPPRGEVPTSERAHE